MALVQFGGGVTQMRGSIGGTCFSRSAAGNIVRARTKPINPRSALQQARRATAAMLTNYWSATLTEQQRTDWRAYAAGTTWTNRLGQVISINGLAAFVRTNALNALSGEAVIAAAPLALGHAAGIVGTFTAEPTASTITLAEPSAGWDKGVDDDWWFIFQYPPTEAGRIAFPKGGRYLTSFEGDQTTPPTVTTPITSLWTMQLGQRMTLGFMHLDPQMRVAVRTFAQAVCADP